MANLLLKGLPIGSIDGVLFDKDGTLSHSEPHLLSLAQRRIDTAASLWGERCSEQFLEAQLFSAQAATHNTRTIEAMLQANVLTEQLQAASAGDELKKASMNKLQSLFYEYAFMHHRS